MLLLHIISSWHGQSDLDDSQDDHETSTEWKFKWHLYFAAGRWPTGKTYKDAVRAAVEEQWPNPTVRELLILPI